MRTSGWLRLWVLTAVIWLGVVAFHSWQKWPRPEITAHNPDFLSQVRPQSALFLCPSSGSAEECEKTAEMIVKMPNGYHLLLSVPDSNPDAQTAAQSYWKVVVLACENGIIQYLLLAAMTGIGPSLAVLLLGFGVVWVFRGFRGHP